MSSSSSPSFTRLFTLLLLGLALAAASTSALPSLAATSSDNPVSNDTSDTLALAKRAQVYHGQATFYDAGLGACSGYNSGSDHVVAINAPQYGNMGQRSSWCGKSIVITYPVLGISQVATVVDACPRCAYGSLNMSRGLFGALTQSNYDLGVFQMTWHLNDGSDDEPTSTKQKPTFTHSSTPRWTPPATSTRPRPTSEKPTWTPEPTTSSTPAAARSSSTSSSSSSTNSTSSTSETPVQTPPVVAPLTENLASLETLFDSLSGMAAAAAN